MALNIPVNLMNTAAPPIQSTGTGTLATDTVSVSAVQPTSAGANTRGTTADGGGLNKGSAEQQALIFKQRAAHSDVKSPDKAEPKSVIAAQTQTDQPVRLTAEGAPANPAPIGPRQSELDRYAPPNPLPTAPILQFAASYAAITAHVD
ncbi:hypothetical protein [Sulfitobacter sp.]|uniref:hypothetical protein n=1 Tax=Sulfitobacter sp. TaxID=1903071 RepID=UPI003EFABD82